MRMPTWCMGIAMLATLMGCDGGDSSSGSTSAQEIEVQCTDEGITLDGDTGTASADGVHLPVTNTTDDDARLVASPVSENPTHTIAPGTETIVVLAPPGEVRLWCGPHNENPKNRSVTVTVKDPQGFYRSVNLADALGCKLDESLDGDPPGWGSTAREAADAFVAQLDAEVKVTEGNGYRDHDRKEFLLYVNGRGYGTLDAYPEPGGRYRASYGTVCSARERPRYNPGTVGGDG
jgi:hypothetical protein